MNDIVRIRTNPRRGRAIIYNGIVYLGGQAADDRSEDIRGQTRQALAKLDKVLGEVGSDKMRILFAQIWIKNIARDFGGFNEVWDEWAGDTAPARAAAQCEMGAPDVLVEIVVTAALSV